MKDENLFISVIAGALIIVAASFVPSAISLYDYCLSLGHSRIVGICFPLIVDLVVLVGHLGAIWLISQGRKPTRAVLLIWGGCLISVAGNILHAPIDQVDGIAIPFSGISMNPSQVIAAVLPLGLVTVSSFLFFLWETKMEIAQDSGQEMTAEERQERDNEAHLNQMISAGITTDKATGKKLIHAPSNRATRKKAKRQSEATKRRNKVRQVESENPELTQPEKAKKVGCSVKTYQRDLQYLSIQG